jgi:arylsulfatase A-like enzyme
MRHWKRRTTSIVVLALVLICVVLLFRRFRRFGWTFKGYNLVMISIDTLRADHLGCYGYSRDTSPNLDALAARSIRFDRAYSTAPWTFPAHFSMFTGHYPARREFFTYPANPHARKGWEHYVTLAEVLKQAGYRTIGATGGAWVSGHLGFSKGFDVYYTHGLHFEDNDQNLHHWIDRHDDSRPYFLFLHGYNVHRPYDPPSDLKRRFIDKIPDECEGVTFKNVEPNKERCLRTTAGEEYAIAMYDAEILGVDRFLAEFLDRLERQGMLRRTILVVLSDHGEEFWDHGGADHTNTLYEELIRIPLILHIPGVTPRVVRTPVSILDLMPTLIDLLDLEKTAPPTQGQSWIPLLEERAEGRVIHAMTARDDAWARENGGAFTLLGVRSNDQILIHRFSKGALLKTELFDLNLDPQEGNDVAEIAEYSRRRSELDAQLNQWMKSSRIEVAEDANRRRDAALNEEVQESLRALGYID